MFTPRKIGMIVTVLLAVAALAGTAIAAETDTTATQIHARATSVPHR